MRIDKSEGNFNLKRLLYFEAEVRVKFLKLLEEGVLTYKDNEVFAMVFRFARDKCGFVPREIAVSLGVTPEIIDAWAAGSEAPDEYVIRIHAVQGVRELLIRTLNGEDAPSRPILGLVKQRLTPESPPREGEVVEFRPLEE